MSLSTSTPTSPGSPGSTGTSLPTVPDDLLSIGDLDGPTIRGILDLAIELKRDPAGHSTALAGRSVALIFEKPSLRTRASLEVGLHRLGAQSVVFDQRDSPLGERESVHDLGRNLERWFDAVAARVNRHAVITELADCCDVPVVNTLSDLHHPCQALADLLTLHERGIPLERAHVAFIGDGNNVCHSLTEAVVATGGRITVIAPPRHGPSADVVSAGERLGAITGGRVEVTDDPEAVRGVDAIYTDAWVSMGETEDPAKLEELTRFRVDESLMNLAGPEAVFMHCLPAHRGEEVVDRVIDGPRSVVFDQAENRLHAQNAWFVARLA
ncbi:MAG: ornithine carbamoyltransferase [Phycisphaerales bacterium]|nr:ornithine carbamoyltransferase [Phycisphaerales bacterium]MDG2132390.1 ornithine carbamoyltransferase [Phycisphaerales bacterium]